MKTHQALKKARSIWGRNAAVQDRGPKYPTTFSGRFIVGRVEMGICFSVKGDGDSWESAFESAAKRDAADKARYAALRKA